MKQLTLLIAGLVLAMSAHAGGKPEKLTLPAGWDKYTSDEVAYLCVAYSLEVARTQTDRIPPDKQIALNALRVFQIWAVSIQNQTSAGLQKALATLEATPAPQLTQQSEYCGKHGALTYSRLSPEIRKLIDEQAEKSYADKVGVAEKARNLSW